MFNRRNLYILGLIVIVSVSFYLIFNNTESLTNGVEEEIIDEIVFNKDPLMEEFNETDGMVIDMELDVDEKNINFPYVTLETRAAERVNEKIDHQYQSLLDILESIEEDESIKIHYQAYVDSEIVYITLVYDLYMDGFQSYTVRNYAIDLEYDNRVLSFQDVVDESMFEYDGDSIIDEGLNLLKERFEEVEYEPYRKKLYNDSYYTWFSTSTKNTADARIRHGNLQIFLDIFDEVNSKRIYEIFTIEQ